LHRFRLSRPLRAGTTFLLRFFGDATLLFQAELLFLIPIMFMVCEAQSSTNYSGLPKMLLKKARQSDFVAEVYETSQRPSVVVQ